MKPSTYSIDGMEKNTVLEDRDQVKAVFAGGNVVHLFVDGVAKPETVRGGNKAFARAEAIRLMLNPEYTSPQSEAEPEKKVVAPEAPVAEQPKANKAGPRAKAPAKAKSKASGEVSKEPDIGSEVFEIGGVSGELTLMPLADVQALFPDFGERLALIRTTDLVQRLQQRVGATDGRCAPIFCSLSADEKDVHLFSGLDTLAAAMNLGLDRVAVVVMPAGELGGIQGIIVAMTFAAASQDQTPGDDLIFRAHSDD